MLKNLHISEKSSNFPIFDTLSGISMASAIDLQGLTPFSIFLTLYYFGDFVMAMIDLSFFNIMISVSSLKPLFSNILSVISVLLKVGT